MSGFLAGIQWGQFGIHSSDGTFYTPISFPTAMVGALTNVFDSGNVLNRVSIINKYQNRVNWHFIGDSGSGKDGRIWCLGH